MKLKSLSYDQVNLPKFSVSSEDLRPSATAVSYFDLSSHSRAKAAISFGLDMRHFNSNIFVMGGDRSGRMSATLDYLDEYIKNFPPAPDWVYLNNFHSNNRPEAFKLPTGQAVRLKNIMEDLVDALFDVFNKTFSSPSFVNRVNSQTSVLEAEVQGEMEKLQEYAAEKGLRIESGEDEFSIVTLEDTEPGTEGEKPYTQNDIQHIRERIGQITSSAHIRGRELALKIHEYKKDEAKQVLTPLMTPLTKGFKECLGEWINDLRNDILDHVDDFLEEEEGANTHEEVRSRYAVNVLVNNKTNQHPTIIVDPSPTYESLFGSIKYKSAPMGYTTDFTLIRSGNLHRANGGILVLRAEAIASDPELWNAIKVALRDRVIRIVEHHRENAMPMLDAPDPKSVPLDIQIFLIGGPIWYYNFFFHDPEFKTYFKIKADIEPDMLASKENISVYTRLIRQFASENCSKEIDVGAVQYLLGYSSRWIANREWLSSKFELIIDVINESSQLATEEGSEVIMEKHVKGSLARRRVRNSGLEDRTHRDIEENVVFIDTQGKHVGVVNGLSVLSTGDHQYGVPNRISSRTYAGEEGIINIERLIEMSGPIQQKGAMILDGFINGKFAQKHPVSCSCTLTFEQSYDEVEGDSASVGELIAILSSLSGVPIRQDLAITGSINQFGQIQAVGGLNHKIEGFFRLCNFRGLTKTQGVVIPSSNAVNVVLRDQPSEAIRDGKFHIWTVDTIEEAIELMMGKPAGTIDEKGNYPKDTIYYLVGQRLAEFAKVLHDKGKGHK